MGFRGKNLSLIDPHWDSVVLYMDADGADASTTFTDESNSGHTLTANGNAQVDTAQSKFGGSSLLCDGTGDYVSAPDSNDWDFGANPFTVEAWVRINASTGLTQVIVGQWDNTDANWQLVRPNAGILQFEYDTGSQIFDFESTTSFNTGQWYHCACTRDANKDMRLFLDGNLEITRNVSSNFLTSAEPLRIGAGFTPINGELDGWIDSVRITKGVCRYVENFNPPPRAFPAVGPA